MIQPSPERAGRPTDEDLTRRILRATGEMLGAHGYQQLSVEQVARSVGCGKTAIYRRYADKGALVAAALRSRVDIGEMPDRGDVRGDLLEHALQNQRNQELSTEQSNGLRAMFEPDVFPSLWESFFQHRRLQGIDILDRAIARGELPENVDHDIVLDTIAGLTLYRQSVKRIHIDERHYVDIIDALVSHPPRRLPDADEQVSDVP
ncbi:TetR/AcrR family transcriptional regulator [Microbacterium oleivorans]|uniref:TetR/AcrR family transcriptional regulator n=1 Tax=Microbacterium oleivorans TaxID=273677 RepID=A0A7D5IZS5_9MICO|nr:TetR/AcrR family transcriptional regulator [Microbacterium oleivorans]QLD13076.1 TetR/AcrR family transcriptional regulator [Microbacterium oleivorans]